MNRNKTYSQLITLTTFEERFNYLKLNGSVGENTFGFNRYLNQAFYRSPEWQYCRRTVILRDNGCDLAIPDRLILYRMIVHHINPIKPEDIERGSKILFDLENLILCSHTTSNALHYGDKASLITLPQERRKGDTRLWT